MFPFAPFLCLLRCCRSQPDYYPSAPVSVLTAEALTLVTLCAREFVPFGAVPVLAPFLFGAPSGRRRLRPFSIVAASAANRPLTSPLEGDAPPPFGLSPSLHPTKKGALPPDPRQHKLALLIYVLRYRFDLQSRVQRCRAMPTKNDAISKNHVIYNHNVR